MKIDIEKIEGYLLDIKAQHNGIESLLSKSTDHEILNQTWIMKGLKYSLIEIAEAMANTLQHILAKERGEPVIGYKETILRAGEPGIISQELSKKLKPFFDFRNSLIHISLVRDNKADFINFIEAIEKYIKE